MFPVVDDNFSQSDFTLCNLKHWQGLLHERTNGWRNMIIMMINPSRIFYSDFENNRSPKVIFPFDRENFLHCVVWTILYHFLASRDILELDTNLPSEKVHEATDVIIQQINSTISELKRLFLVEDLVDSVKVCSSR